MAYCHCQGSAEEPYRGCCPPVPPPAPCCLEGPPGVTGPMGATGPVGATGPTGATGATGAAATITPAAAVNDSVGTVDVVEQFNTLLANLRAAGLLES